MPVIAQSTIPIRINPDHTIDIISTIATEIKKCGCLQIKDTAQKLNISNFEIKNAVKQLVGEQKLACNNGESICCADQAQLDQFIVTMRKLRGDI